MRTWGSDADQDAGESLPEDGVGVLFQRQASRLLPDVVTISSLECVQACLLMGVYTLPIGASGLSYIYLNFALKLAIQNGMHRRCPGTGLDASACETRNRVWWSLYTIERRVGIFHGRPTSISNGHVDADSPAELTTWLPSHPTHYAQILAALQLNQKLDMLSQEINIPSTSPNVYMKKGYSTSST
ncbi:uncharacterized protein UV8b_07056 [Ustilaginoidea virens]|uniref:Xylanolytic transcriptional activator regulatory domain-containing protein n=1 Tax=Ustilaginoidea virens TaxID=1159556 RepID=A0A8E5HWR3_USTVR|nr:uncharacterized protein UV8b_07056 [Ustilaginoidea virens]QUC22815.1 hypothetical protein UV8b_07056 [Ustilaginoidea virens]